MKRILLPLLLLILFIQCIHAQNYDWFKGSWYGIKSFTNAPLGIKALVRLEIDSFNNSQFSGRFIYMYPADTAARLIRTFSGDIKNAALNINKSRETYLRSPLMRSFWSDCSPCKESGYFSFNDSAILFTINTAECGDSCNGKTVFSREINQYNSVTKADIKKVVTDLSIVVTKKTKNKKTVHTITKNSTVTINGLNDSLKQKSVNSTNAGKPIVPGEITKTAFQKVNGNVSALEKHPDSLNILKQAPAGINKQADTIAGGHLPNNALNSVTASTPGQTNNDSLKQATLNTTPDKNLPVVTLPGAKNNKGDTLAYNRRSKELNKRNHAAVTKIKKDTLASADLSMPNELKRKLNISDSVDAELQPEMPGKNPLTNAQNIIADTAVENRISRKTDLAYIFKVTTSHIQVELFDNGEVDSDVVSVYYNGGLIVSNAMLSTKPITFFVDASPTNRHLELTLIAENEGLLPPNSALMRIKAGDRQYQLFISTSLVKNVKVAIDYLGN